LRSTTSVSSLTWTDQAGGKNPSGSSVWPRADVRRWSPANAATRRSIGSALEGARRQSTGKPDEIETTPVRFGEGVAEKCRAITATRRHPTLPHVRFDERDLETETGSIPQTPATERAGQQVMIAPTSTAPDLDSTRSLHRTAAPCRCMPLLCPCSDFKSNSYSYRIHLCFSPKVATPPFIARPRISRPGARVASHRKQYWRRLLNRARLRTGRCIASPLGQGSKRRRESDHGL
jgi:hypothetical protein